MASGRRRQLAAPSTGTYSPFPTGAEAGGRGRWKTRVSSPAPLSPPRVRRSPVPSSFQRGSPGTASPLAVGFRARPAPSGRPGAGLHLPLGGKRACGGTGARMDTAGSFSWVSSLGAGAAVGPGGEGDRHQGLPPRWGLGERGHGAGSAGVPGPPVLLSSTVVITALS